MLDFKVSHLRLLAEIMRTGSLSEAGASLGMSPSSASRVLKRLQEELDDPLFIRSWRGMVPTERVASMMPTVRNLLSELDSLDQTKMFEPSALRMTLTIGAADNAIVAILLPVVRALMREAPGVRIRLVPLCADQFERLMTGEMDFLLYPTAVMPQLPSHFRGLDLFSLPRALLVAKDHPLALAHAAGKTVTPEMIGEYPRVLVRLSDKARGSVFNVSVETSPVEEPAIELPYFLGAPYFLEGTLNTLVLPSKTAEFFARQMPALSVLPWPGEQPENRTRLVWHERTDRSVHMQWIRSIFCKYAGSLDDETI